MESIKYSSNECVASSCAGCRLFFDNRRSEAATTKDSVLIGIRRWKYKETRLTEYLYRIHRYMQLHVITYIERKSFHFSDLRGSVQEATETRELRSQTLYFLELRTPKKSQPT